MHACILNPWTQTVRERGHVLGAGSGWEEVGGSERRHM